MSGATHNTCTDKLNIFTYVLLCTTCLHSRYNIILSSQIDSVKTINYCKIKVTYFGLLDSNMMVTILHTEQSFLSCCMLTLFICSIT